MNYMDILNLIIIGLWIFIPFLFWYLFTLSYGMRIESNNLKKGKWIHIACNGGNIYVNGTKAEEIPKDLIICEGCGNETPFWLSDDYNQCDKCYGDKIE